jgi:hypothetical protein
MKTLTVVSVLLALTASFLLLVLPTYATTSAGVEGRATLLQVNGPGVLIPLAAPVLIALLPLVFPKRAVHIGAAMVLGLFALVGGFSIGLFYIPSVVVMALAAFRLPTQRLPHQA